MCSDRIARAVQQIDYFLREIRRTSRAGQMSGGLAIILRARLGKNERLGGAVAFVQSLQPNDLEKLAFILGGPTPMGEIDVASDGNGAGPRNGYRGGERKTSEGAPKAMGK